MIKHKANPWESSFENLTSGIKQATSVIAKDVKEQLTGNNPTERADEMGVKEVPEAEKDKILSEQRQKMKELDEAIKRARQERLQKHQQAMQAKKQEEEKKKIEEKKKLEEPVWKKAMRMGADAEKKVNAGG